MATFEFRDTATTRMMKILLDARGVPAPRPLPARIPGLGRALAAGPVSLGRVQYVCDLYSPATGPRLVDAPA